MLPDMGLGNDFCIWYLKHKQQIKKQVGLYQMKKLLHSKRIQNKKTTKAMELDIYKSYWEGVNIQNI